MSLNNHLALVTGASSGLGQDFARQLAAAGCDVVLVARREENLMRLAEDIQSKTGRQAIVRRCDLGSPAERASLVADFPRVDILVNNAGLGVYGRFAESSWDRVSEMLEVDVAALTHLTHLFLPGMRERGWGRILQVASTAAFQPCPSYAAYAAAKSYVLNFSLALHHELKGSGVSCTTLCPGPTATEFFEVSGHKLGALQRNSVMSAEQVAAIGVKAMEKSQPYVVAGAMNTLMAWSVRLLPLTLAVAIADRVTRSGN